MKILLIRGPLYHRTKQDSKFEEKEASRKFLVLPENFTIQNDERISDHKGQGP